jgi:hypothetical protein
VPYVTRDLTRHGAVLDILVGVHMARRDRLRNAGFPVPSRIRVPAQIDTGTEFSTIDIRILANLQINPIDEIEVRTPSPADGPQRFDLYPVSLSLDHAEGIELIVPTVQVLGCWFTEDEGIQAMLGRDVLQHCLFFLDGKAGVFSLAY